MNMKQVNTNIGDVSSSEVKKAVLSQSCVGDELGPDFNHSVSIDATPRFQPFEWVSRPYQTGPYDLIADTRDLVGGACAIMEMIEKSELDSEGGDAPMFNDYHKGRLVRMAIAALRTIEMQASSHLGKMQEKGEQGRKGQTQKAGEQ